jgi:hypothetical protein
MQLALCQTADRQDAFPDIPQCERKQWDDSVLALDLLFLKWEVEGSGERQG